MVRSKIAVGLVVFASLAAPAWSAGVNLKAVTVAQLADVVFRAYLGRDYVIHPDVVAMEDRVTVSLGDASKDRAEAVIRAVLGRVGVEVEDVAGVAFLRRARASAPAFEPSQVAPVNGFMRTALALAPASGVATAEPAPSSDVPAPDELVGVVGVGDAALVLLADGRSAPADEARSERWGWSYRVGADWFSWRYRVPRAVVASAPAPDLAPSASADLLKVPALDPPAKPSGVPAEASR